MKRRTFLKLTAAGALSFIGVSAFTLKSELLVYAGSVNIPPLEKLIDLYGSEVKAIYGGSGNVLTQAIISRKGDIYLPGSNDFMELAVRKGAVYEDTIKILAYLIPAVVVRRDNPKGIEGLEDLERDGVKIAIANPESVAIGLYAVELFEANGLNVKERIISMTRSYSDLLTLLKTGVVDAVIGWDVSDDWDESLKVILPEPEQIPRVAYIPIAIMKYTSDFETSLSFLNFVYENRWVYGKMGYFVSLKEVKKVAPRAKIGGIYKLPARWKSA